MTISTTSRKAGPFNGNGSTTAFPFTFKVLSASDLVITKTNTSGANSTLTIGANPTVVLNLDQDSSPGGTLTYATLATGEKLTITTNMPATQEVDITNGSGFFASVIETALDRVVILVQQALNKLDRSIKFPVSDTTLPIELPTAVVRAGKALVFDNLGQVALSSTPFDDQAAAAAISAAAAETAASLAEGSYIAASTAAGNALSSATAAATSASNAATSASTAVTSANNAATIYDNFDDRYLGAKSSDPTLDNDGNALLNGALYFSSSSNAMRVYSTGLAAWQPAASTVVRNGTGAPSAGLGSDGDFYINTTVYDLYGPKTAGSWGAPASLVGPNGPGTGDVLGPAASIDGEIALFQSTTGKVIKRAAFSGLVKLVSGVASAASSAIDYVAPGLFTAAPLTMNTARLLGRTTAGIGAAQEITVGAGLTLSGGALTFVGGAGDHEVVVHTGNGYGSTNTAIRRFTTALTNVGTAITYADSATNGASFTINETGLYSLHYTDGTAGAGLTYGISNNSAALTTSISAIPIATRQGIATASGSIGFTVARVVRLTAGDVIRAHTGGEATPSTNNITYFAIRKVNT